MEKNLLASLALAGSILAAEAVKGQEGADTAAKATNKALIELLSELPAGFDSARKVIEGDVVLTDDGNLSDSDRLVIEDHMGKLAAVVPENARKVREAMNGVETIVAEGQVAALTETREEKKERERKQKLLDDINEKFFREENWRITGTATLKVRKDKVEVNFSSKDSNNGKRADVCFFMPIESGEYEINLTSTGEGILGFWVYDKNENIIQLSPGQDRTFLQNGLNKFQLPAEVKSIRIGLFTTLSTPSIEVTGLQIAALK